MTTLKEYKDQIAASNDNTEAPFYFESRWRERVILAPSNGAGAFPVGETRVFVPFDKSVKITGAFDLLADAPRYGKHYAIEDRAGGRRLSGRGIEYRDTQNGADKYYATPKAFAKICARFSVVEIIREELD